MSKAYIFEVWKVNRDGTSEYYDSVKTFEGAEKIVEKAIADGISKHPRLAELKFEIRISVFIKEY
jgi:hypothetical protein